VALSIKRLTRNPWDLISARYLPGDVAHAVVTSVARFGVFARLEEGIEGLIHISLMKVPTGRADLKGAYKEGQPVLVRIVHIDTQKRRLSLSLVALEQEE
jgi:small subunit ribosomal protein S1